MSGFELSKVVSGSFLRRFAGLAQSNASAPFSSLTSNSQGFSLSSGLRLGAQTFSNAVQGLNSSVSLLNVAEDTLRGLLKITDQMIVLAESAAQSGIGSDARSSRNTEFQRLRDDFRKVVESADKGGIDLLSKGGIENLLSSVGLSTKQSGSLRRLFDKFLTPLEDDFLASEKVKSGRPVNVSPSAYQNPLSATTYQLQRVTNFDVSTSSAYIPRISSNSAVFGKVDNILNQSPGENAPFIIDQNGTISSLDAGSLSGSAQLRGILAVNEQTGSFLIQSNGDFLGNNAGGFWQIFVVTRSGDIVQQVTNNTSSDVNYTFADMSGNDLSFAYVEKNETNPFNVTETLKTVAMPSWGMDPASQTANIIDTVGSGATLSNLKVNNSGTKLIYRNDSLTESYFFAFDGSTSDSDFTNDAGTTTLAGFLDDDTVGFFADFRIKEYTYGAGSGSAASLTDNDPDITHAVFLEGQQGQGSFAMFNSADSELYLYNRISAGTANEVDLNGSAVGSAYSIATGDTVHGLSLALTPGNTIDIGIVGALAATAGDPDAELYRLKFNPLSATRQRLSAQTNEPELVLDGDISRRSDAIRVGADLEAIKEQIENNIAALKKARLFVQDNITLVRSAGSAFLEISSQIKDAEDADRVAERVREAIRRKAGAALAQAENLEPIVVATLAL